MATGTSPSTAEEALRTTDEKANFQRLARLLISGGLALLRDVFDAKHPPANLPAVLGNPAIKTQLKTLRRIRVLSQTEWDYLYNSGGPGTYGKSADFDISLLCKLLRAICSLTPPATGWDILPNGTDHSLEADLVRIKFYRNKIYGHNHSMEVKDADFEKLWMEISEALLRIASRISSAKRDEWKKSIEKFSHEPLTPDAKECVDELRLWYLMEMDTKYELEKLDEKMKQMQIKQEQMRMEILIVLESLKARGPVVSSSPQVEKPQLPSERLETRIAMPPEQPSAESASSLSTSTELHALSQQNRPAVLDFWHVVYSFKSSLNLFISYLKMKLGVDVEDYRLGSLVITVSCSSLKVLEALWKEYRTGHLNKVVQATLVTAEVLEKLHLSEVKLRVIISEEDYLSYKEFLSYRQGKTEMITHQEPAVLAPKLATAQSVSYQLIYYLARGLGKNWRDLGRTLGISVRKLSEIDRKTELLDHEKGMTMLQEWKVRLGDDATVEVLQDALKDLGIKDPALKLKSGIPKPRKLKEFSIPFHVSARSTGQQQFPRVISMRASSLSGGYRKRYTGKWHARRDGTAGGGGEKKTKSLFAPISPPPRTWTTGESTHFPLSKAFQRAYTTAPGYVLIINNHTFSDPHHSKEFFAHKFGFETREDINLTKRAMLKVLTDTARRDFSTNDCFFCIVVSHGTADGICGTDNKSIEIERITSLFCPKICPSLKGKPKIFLIEATGGETWKRLGYLKWRKVKSNSYVPQRPVISEEDFLVSCASSASHSSLFNLLGTGMELMDAINATDTEQLWLVSTLKRKVFLNREVFRFQQR